MNGVRRRLGLRLLLVAGLALASLPVTVAPAGAVPCAPKRMEYLTLNTLHVDLGRLKKSYRKGQVVAVKVRVTRPSENDPVGLGLAVDRPVSHPAEEINVGIGLSIGRVFLPGYGLSNQKGKATIKIRIERFVPAGKKAHLQAYAYYEQANTPCLVVEEQGYRAKPNAFKIKR